MIKRNRPMWNYTQLKIFSKPRIGWPLVVFLPLVSVPIIGYALVLSDYENTSTVTPSASQYELVTGNNDSTIQITPNAEIVFVKEVTNDNGGDAVVGDFNIVSDAGAITFGAGVTVVDVTTYTSATVYVPPGTYTLEEDNLPGYTEGSWSCTVGTVGDPTFNSGDVTLTFGQQTVCTIANDDIAPQLTLVKNVVNTFGPALAPTDFDPSIESVEVVSGVANAVDANTALTVSEAPVAGYTAGAWNCSDANSLTTGLPTAGTATGVDVTLEAGSDVTCTITNTAVQPLLTLSKTVINANGGTLGVDDFNISINGTEVTNNVQNPVASGTAITISELDVASYAEGTWSCVDDIATVTNTGLPTTGLATSTSLTLLPGSEVTCSITNDDLGIDLAIAKSVDDNTPNIGDTITFTLSVTNAGPDVATAVAVSDIVPAGFTYVAASITGGDSSDDTDPAGTGLSWTLNSVPVAGAPIDLTFEAVVLAP